MWYSLIPRPLQYRDGKLGQWPGNEAKCGEREREQYSRHVLRFALPSPHCPMHVESNEGVMMMNERERRERMILTSSSTFART